MTSAMKRNAMQAKLKDQKVRVDNPAPPLPYAVSHLGQRHELCPGCGICTQCGDRHEDSCPTAKRTPAFGMIPWGLWDTVDPVWLGTSVGPVLFGVRDLAQAAAEIINTIGNRPDSPRVGWGVDRVVARYYDSLREDSENSDGVPAQPITMDLLEVLYTWMSDRSGESVR